MPFASIPAPCDDGVFRGRYPLGSTAAPQLSPPPGSYASAKSIVLSCATQNALIYYTLDGSQPNQSSAIYSQPIALPLGSNLILTAIAIAPNFLLSLSFGGAYIISNANPLMAGWPDPLPDGALGVPYSFTLTASGGTQPYTFGLVAGSVLPAGLSLNPTSGLISGTPTSAASFQGLVFFVTDSSS